MSEENAIVDEIFSIEKWKANPDKNLLVIAKNLGQFHIWLRENNISPKYRDKQIQYAKDLTSIAGRQPSNYHLIGAGEFWINPLYDNEKELLIHGFTIYPTW
jgi:hypothetical protein